MNANRIIDMIIKRLVRIAVTKGVDMGINGASKVARKASDRRGGQSAPDREESWIDDHGNVVTRRPRGAAKGGAQRGQIKQTQKTAKHAMKMARRMGRF